MVKLVPVVALFALSGCNSINYDQRPPADWPELRVVIHKSGFMARQECNGTLGGCAVPNFCAKRCDVYLQVDSRAIEAHERAHCAGYDHPGDDTMRGLWEGYKWKGNGAALCALQMGTPNYCALWPEDKARCA